MGRNISDTDTEITQSGFGWSERWLLVDTGYDNVTTGITSTMWKNKYIIVQFRHNSEEEPCVRKAE